jgi:hypothetical protein
MSKTINDLLNEGQEAKNRVRELNTLLTNEVNQDATLAGLNSSSKTATWRLQLYVFAAMSWLQEQVWKLFKKEVDDIISKAIPGTDRWLANEVLKFQLGDPLQFDVNTGKYSYAVIDESKQVVKRIAVTSTTAGTVIKAAAEDINGEAIPLTADEQNSLRAYVHNIQFAGAALNVVSYAADLLKLRIEVYYNALRPVEQIKSEVNTAINGYLSGLDFNGTFYRSKLMDAIQAVDSVEDVVMHSVQAKPETGEYTELERIYTPLSGYLNIDPLFPLENEEVITYKPS